MRSWIIALTPKANLGLCRDWLQLHAAAETVDEFLGTNRSIASPCGGRAHKKDLRGYLSSGIRSYVRSILRVRS